MIYVIKKIGSLTYSNGIRMQSRSVVQNIIEHQWKRGFLNFSDSNIEKKKMDRKLRNQEIQSKYIQLIDEQGNKLGIKPLWRTLKEMDFSTHVLIQLEASEDNPLCRIYNIKQIYEKEKALQASKKQMGGGTKEFKLSILISEHDMNTKLNQAKKALLKGHLAQFQINGSTRNKRKLKGEEPKINELLNKVKLEMDPISTVHKPPSLVESIGYATFKVKKEMKNKEPVKDE